MPYNPRQNQIVKEWRERRKAIIIDLLGGVCVRTVAVIIWLSLFDLLFNYFALCDGSPDFGTKAIFL
jgi:hypothetical protein